VVKKELAWEPLGTIIRATGGIFIDRRSRAGLVGQIAEIVKALSPPSRRSPLKVHEAIPTRWKSGFYYIAVDAGVPIVSAHLNYQRKRFGARAPFMPTGDLKADEVLIRDYYAQLGRGALS
jgi:1-acyl-sn-glycerol-3-phosphate acyltransferase